MGIAAPNQQIAFMIADQPIKLGAVQDWILLWLRPVPWFAYLHAVFIILLRIQAACKSKNVSLSLK